MPPHRPAGSAKRAVSSQRSYHKGDIRCVPRFLMEVPPAAKGLPLDPGCRGTLGLSNGSCARQGRYFARQALTALATPESTAPRSHDKRATPHPATPAHKCSRTPAAETDCPHTENTRPTSPETASAESAPKPAEHHPSRTGSGPNTSKNFRARIRLTPQLRHPRRNLDIHVRHRIEIPRQLRQVLRNVCHCAQMNFVFGCRAITRFRASIGDWCDGKSLP